MNQWRRRPRRGRTWLLSSCWHGRRTLSQFPPTGGWRCRSQEQRDVFQPKTLQYKVLIRLDTVTTFPDGEEPWFLGGGSSGSGQSGLPDSDNDMGGGATTRRCVWQFGIRDARGDNAGGRADAPAGQTYAGAVLGVQEPADWRIPPMAPVRQVGQGRGPTSTVLDRLTQRQSAFDRLGGAVGRERRPLCPCGLFQMIGAPMRGRGLSETR